MIFFGTMSTFLLHSAYRYNLVVAPALTALGHLALDMTHLQLFML
jgi:hypothetical protein